MFTAAQSRWIAIRPGCREFRAKKKNGGNWMEPSVFFDIRRSWSIEETEGRVYRILLRGIH